MGFVEQDNGNTIIGEPTVADDSAFVINGSGNIVVFEPGVSISKSKISIKGNNSLVYIGNVSQQLRANITVGSDACLYIGRDSFFHSMNVIRINVDNQGIMCLGNDLLSSLSVRIDTAGDGNVLIVGDHSWLCQGSSVLGNSIIARNTIIASKARMHDCTTEPFSCWGGDNRKLLSDVLFSKTGMRLLEKSQLLLRDQLPPSEAKEIEEVWGGVASLDFAQQLQSCHDAQGRLDLITQAVVSSGYTRITNPNLAATSGDKKGYISQLIDDRENTVIGGFVSGKHSTQLLFCGEGNLLILEPGVVLDNCNIKFNGSRGLVYLSSSSKPYRFVATISSDSSVFIGHNNAFADTGARVQLSPSEGKAIVIGNDNSFGKGVWVRTSDQHAIYSRETLMRINHAESVVIKNGSSLGNGCIVQKGAVVDREDISADQLVLRKKGEHRDELSKLADQLSSKSLVAARKHEAQRFAKRNRR